MIANIVPAVFVVGLLIFVHELGHFLVAKAKKVRVEKFSLGFGPKIISHHIGETDYMLSLIPLGGYVKMAGESFEDKREGRPDEFLSKKVSERLGIVAAGPLMNIGLTVVIFAILFSLGLPYIPGQVGTVLKDSPAEKAGLKAGDLIKEINGQAIDDWAGLTRLIQRNPEKELQLKIKRGREEIAIGVKPRLEEKSKIGLIGITPYYGRKAGRVSKNSAAYKAGLREGDEIIKVNGQAVSQWDEILNILEKEGPDIFLIIGRKGEEIKINFFLPPGEESKLSKLDFYPALPVKKYSPLLSLGLALNRTFYLIKVIYLGLWQLVTGQVSMKFIGGPLLIAQLAGQEAQLGLTNLFLFIALISVNLAVLNFLPIPILDGGHIFFLAIEGVTRKPVSKRKQELAQQVGMFILIALMLFATYNDILRFVAK